MRAVDISTTCFRRRGDEALHQVDVIIVVMALQDCGQSLQAHAGVNGGLGQRNFFAARHLFELHKDQIPDFDEAISIFIWCAGGTARNTFPMIKEYL